MEKQGELRRLMPLTETSFYILICLAEPLHGYGIMQKVGGLSGGRIMLGPGTLYGALGNLRDAGLIEPCDGDTGNPRRKEYSITPRGRDLVGLELERLRQMVRHGEVQCPEPVQGKE